jgi:[protein-PII] uridylyltransferase
MPSDPLPLGARAAPGRGWCEARTAAVDEAVASVWDGLRGAAVFALGGYARRELCPASDVDLLLLHGGRRKEELESLVQAVVYPLWDAGLTVGYAVHTPADVLRKARTQVDSATALLDRRLVAGDPGLADQLSSRIARMLRQHASRLVRDLADADHARRDKAGERAGMLEPDLKSGAGGLRDLASLRWGAAALLGEPSLDRLVGARYLGAGEYGELNAAAETLLEVRCALHLVLGVTRPGASADRLRLDVQGPVAECLGDPDADRLLRRVGLAMRAVAHAHQRVWPRLLEDAVRGRGRRREPRQGLGPAVALVNGCVEIDETHAITEEPAVALSAALAAATRGVPLSRVTAARLRRNVDGVRLTWDAAAREAFVGLLRTGPRMRAAWADLDHAGVISALLPDWTRVRGRPQRNPYHRFDLDTHAVETVAELADLVDEPGPAGAAWEALGEDQGSLLLAALLHDVGKAWPGDHSEQGAVVAGTWLRHMGFPEAQAAWVAELVGKHLLLPNIATRRDLDDDAEIEAAAAAVGPVRTLDALYLLALADGRATGPTAGSPWRELLLAELHARVRSRLEPGSQRSTSPAFGTAEPFAAAGSDTAHVTAAPGPAAGTAVLDVRVADRAGLLADCAGALAANDLSVLEVRADTREAGSTRTGVDRFVVEAPADTDWDAVTADLLAAADGLPEVDEQVARLERRLARRGNPPSGPARVLVEPGGVGLRIEVRAWDRPGLLYRLTRALADAGLEVVGARAQTLGTEVRDVFFVRGGGSASDGRVLEELLLRVAEPSR